MRGCLNAICGWDGMVIIGHRSSKSTFGANNNVLRNDGTSKTRLNSGVLTMTQEVNLTQ